MRISRRLCSLALIAAGLDPMRAEIAYPERGSADRIARARIRDLLALAPESPEDRTIHPPLRTKDYSQLNPTDAVSPAMERAIALARDSVTLPLVTAPATPRTLTGFRGIPDEVAGVPPDTYGAISPQHVMTTLNTSFQVQSRDGAVLWKMTFAQFFRPVGPFSTGISDPRVAFDPASQRWYVCAVADFEDPSSSILLAVSQSADPTADWVEFRVRTDTPDQWFDYPTMAIAGDWLMITTNAFRGDNYVRTRIHVFSKGDLLGGSAPFRAFADNRGTLAPAAGPPTLARVPIVGQSSNLGGRGSLLIGELIGPPGLETLETRVMNVAVDDPWSSTGAGANDFAPQLGSPALISTNDSRMQNCLVRGTSLWCTHHVFLPAGAPNRSLVQYYELDTANSYRLVQRGRVEDTEAATMYAYPSIAVNQSNDALIGYSRFRADQYAAAAYSFRRGSDPPGQLQPDTTIKLGEAPYQRGTRNRWGDYSNTLVDPVDDLSFWTVQQYAASTAFSPNRWGTWWGQITPVAQPCTYQLSSSEFPVGPEASSLQVTVTTAQNCAWMAAADAGWMSVTSGNPGRGTGVVTAQVEFNPFSGARNATLTVAGQPVTIRQSGNPAPPPTQLSVTFLSTPISGAAGARVSVRVTVQNTSAVPATRFRVGFYFSTDSAVTASDLVSPDPCDYPSGLLPRTALSCTASVTVPRALAPGTYFLAAIADDRLETTMTDRSQSIRFSDTGPFTALVSPNAPAINPGGIAHGATTQGGAVSPGQNVVIYGLRLGPANLVGLRLDSTGKVATTLAGTRVFFDGVPAPIHYTSAGQVSAFVPYSVEGKTESKVQAQFNDLFSSEMTVAVANLMPGLYSLDFRGRGPGAIVNQDGTINGREVPAARGSVVLLFATGHGPLVPPGTDGEVIRPPLPALALGPVEVTIGGIAARLLYAGPMPEVISGVLQMNVEIPAGAPVGDAVPVSLRIAGVAAPDGITIAIR